MAASATKASVPTLATYPGTVGVFAMHLDQRGDIIGGLNIHNRVKKMLASGKVIFSYIDPLMHQMMLKMGGRQIIPVEDIIDCKENHVVKLDSLRDQIAKFGTIIIFPAYDDGMLPDSIRKSGVPLIKLREPGAGPADPEIVEGEAYTLGLSDKEIGVVLSEQVHALRAYFKAHKNDSLLQRLTNLATLPPALVKVILGHEYSQEAVEAFHKKGKLFYGYGNAPEISSTFVNSHCSLSSTEDVTVCLTNTCPEDYLSLLDQRLLFKGGFSTIQILTRNPDGSYSSVKNVKFARTKGDRVLKVVFTPMSQDQAFTLQKSADPRTLACSENSLFESLALGGFCAFDVREHKHEFILDFIARFEKKNNKLGLLLKMAYFGGPKPGHVVDVRLIFKGMQTLFTEIEKNGDLRQDWEAVVDDMLENCDFCPRLEQILCKTLKLEPPSKEKTKADEKKKS